MFLKIAFTNHGEVNPLQIEPLQFTPMIASAIAVTKMADSDLTYAHFTSTSGLLNGEVLTAIIDSSCPKPNRVGII
jgi:hypothetical protein